MLPRGRERLEGESRVAIDFLRMFGGSGGYKSCPRARVSSWCEGCALGCVEGLHAKPVFEVFELARWWWNDQESDREPQTLA
jgi:hypothetical protein